MEPTPNASLVTLKELAQRATKGPWRSSGSAIEADSLWRLAHTNSYHADWRQNADYIAAASPDVVLGLLQQLAAAEARATEAAAEAGKVAGLLVKAETELASLRDRLAQEQRVTAQQEGQMLALVQETHRWSEAEKRDKVRHQEEVDELKQELALLKPMLNACDSLRREGVAILAAHTAAPAPVAPQQQEGGGQ